MNLKTDALHWLENSINHGFINYPYLKLYDPFLDQIRDETQFKELMERVKFEWENFEVQIIGLILATTGCTKLVNRIQS